MTDNQFGHPPGRDLPGPLAVRSPAEAQMYLALHPCDCGTPRQGCTQELLDRGDAGLASVHAGICPGCGRHWSVMFSLPASPPPAGHIGGSDPSQVIDPGEWYWLADQDASIPVSSPADRARLEHAAALIEEVIKFIPPGADRVPATAFASPAGRALLDAFPGRFLKADLEFRARLYKTGARMMGPAAAA